MVQPISPCDVKNVIPDSVIEVFNELIQEKWNGEYAKIIQNEIVEKICKRLDIKRHIVFENHWLDIEDLYRKQGWKVKYNKPAYYEPWGANFIFEKN